MPPPWRVCHPRRGQGHAGSGPRPAQTGPGARRDGGGRGRACRSHSASCLGNPCLQHSRPPPRTRGPRSGMQRRWWDAGLKGTLRQPSSVLKQATFMVSKGVFTNEDPVVAIVQLHTLEKGKHLLRVVWRPGAAASENVQSMGQPEHKGVAGNSERCSWMRANALRPLPFTNSPVSTASLLYIR